MYGKAIQAVAKAFGMHTRVSNRHNTLLACMAAQHTEQAMCPCSYPEMVPKILPFCGSARTSAHNKVRPTSTHPANILMPGHRCVFICLPDLSLGSKTMQHRTQRWRRRVQTGHASICMFCDWDFMQQRSSQQEPCMRILQL